MKKLVLFLFILPSASVFSQGFLTSKSMQFELTGFVRNDLIFDSRKNVDACDHLLEMYPLKPDYDAAGEDIHAQPSVHLLNTFTRFGSRFSGLGLGNAKISAYAEIDFTGGSLTPTLRLRHAYTQFAWPKTKLLFGRTWHPTFIEKVYPVTLNENTGLPFQVFNRSPQVRLTKQLTSNLDLIAAAVYQFDYSNTGPAGKTYQYQRDALIPNLHTQFQFYNDNWVLGAAADWKSIQPRTSTTGANNKKYKTTEKLNTMAVMAYFKYSKEKFLFMGKSMLGQNMCESLIPGYYAVATVNPSTGAETYTPSNHLYNWINVCYGTTWKFGIYAGYLKNFGTSVNPVGPMYGTATDVDMIYKISPQLIYSIRNFMFGCEWSWTTAAYGNIDYSDKAKVKNSENVTNFRNMISVAYNF